MTAADRPVLRYAADLLTARCPVATVLHGAFYVACSCCTYVVCITAQMINRGVATVREMIENKPDWSTLKDWCAVLYVAMWCATLCSRLQRHRQ